MEATEETELEILFEDRFSEKDSKYMEVKSKHSTPPQPVIYPWKIPGRVIHKKWDVSGGRRDRHRYDDGRNRYDSRQSYRDRSHDDRYNSNRGDRDHSRESSSGQKWDDRNRDRRSNDRYRH